MVPHRDIKASNIMLDSSFRARLGDFGIACTVAANKSYVTGIAGTFGYIAPDYAMSTKLHARPTFMRLGYSSSRLSQGRRTGISYLTMIISQNRLGVFTVRECCSRLWTAISPLGTRIRTISFRSMRLNVCFSWD
ncbi:hypothetical protein PR202_ga03612 [Eleusine coracana subsp. coracana]|uniref:Protein kinase domain-containing protein n=1 Tax=Eleusine coracana subsp. coracana TaxID=191504 RepID=A0AAV5BN32_ELECO|nr:hypothetical protein PR202_ga03612 [Eleusine coracana subsp. coracana]